MLVDYNLHYNFIYLNTNYTHNCGIDKNEYNAICLRDAERMKDVKVFPCPLYHYPVLIRKLFRRAKISKYNFLKKLFYPFLLDIPQKSNKPYCFVVASSYYPLDYLDYLRASYPNCKIVMVSRDLIKINFPEYDIQELVKIFSKSCDLVMTYDYDEALKYNFSYFNEIESKVDIPISPEYPLCDVFFAGRVKDRLPKILKAYDIFTSAGLKCEFYITNVEKKDQVSLPGITYSDLYMPYLEMLYKSVNSRCMLDINQGEAVGYTSRFLEAVVYNKRIIIDNKFVKTSQYYPSKYIQYIENIEDIDPSFVLDDEEVNYNYAGDFSPIHLIKQIDDELVNKFNVKEITQ